MNRPMRVTTNYEDIFTAINGHQIYSTEEALIKSRGLSL